jgi:hypothetical protein
MQGSRGQVTRQGGKDSGIETHVRGWNVGGMARMISDNEDNDTCIFSVTSGSNGSRGSFGPFAQVKKIGDQFEIEILIEGHEKKILV